MADKNKEDIWLRLKSEINHAITDISNYWDQPHPRLASSLLTALKKPLYLRIINKKSREKDHFEIEEFKAEMNLEQISKVALMHGQNRQFKEILPLHNHHSLIVQSKTDFQEITKRIKEMLEYSKVFENGMKTEDQKMKEQERLLKKQYESLVYPAIFPWAFNSSKYRIICFIKDEFRLDENYYIYHSAVDFPTKSLQEINQPLDSHSISEELHQIMNALFVKQKHSQLLIQFKNSFKKSLKNQLSEEYQKIEIFKNKKKAESHELFTKKNFLSNYEKYHSQMLIKRWQDQTKKYENAKSIFVQVSQITFENKKIPSKVTLTVNNNNSDEKQYEYSELNHEYFSYRLKSTGRQKKNCFKSPLDRALLGKEIVFTVKMWFKDSKEVLTMQKGYIYFDFSGQVSAFSHELILQNEGNNFNCMIYFQIMQSRKPNVQNISSYSKSALFEQIGSIPTKYKSTLQIQYTPNNFPFIATLLARSNFKLTKHNYQSLYLDLVSFIQKSENQSQNSILFDSSEGRYLMGNRLTIYKRKLSSYLGYSYDDKVQLSTYFKTNFEESYLKVTKSKNAQVSAITFKNLQEDLTRLKPAFKEIVRFHLQKLILFSESIGKGNNIKQNKGNNILSEGNNIFSEGNKIKYNSGLVLIVDKFLCIIYSHTESDMRRTGFQRLEHDDETFWTILSFLMRMYPYFNVSSLQQDLYLIRILVQDRLPYFNSQLNRKHIGLQNLIAEHLLTLFTNNISPELTFRIWDLLINSTNPAKARLIICYTLLVYYQTTDLLPIIPINQFMKDVEINLQQITYPPHQPMFQQHMQFYCQDQLLRRKTIIQIGKENPNHFLANDKYLKRFILGEMGNKIPFQEEGKAFIDQGKAINQKQVFKSKLLSVHSLTYPLPQPSYMGETIHEVRLFLQNIQILDSLHLIEGKYLLKIFNLNWNFNAQYPLREKKYFINEPVCIKISEQAKNKSKQLHFSIINCEEKGLEIMKGSVSIENFHKDKIYKTHVRLVPLELKNKGQSLLSLVICLKTSLFQVKSNQRSFQAFQKCSERLLDYDFSEDNNNAMKQLGELLKQFEQIKNPLDQFGKLKYNRLKVSAVNLNHAEWIENSKITIQELKAIFYSIFYQEKEKEIRLDSSRYYKMFSEENNYQYIYLSKLLLTCVLMTNISKKKKLTYLYCLGVHYQSCYSKRLSTESFNSLMREIQKVYGFLNACPYDRKYYGEIIEAYFFESNIKDREQKRDFTRIVQDWTYICTLKYGYNALLLGTASDLSVLRSLFDITTLKQIQLQPTCRFQIIYSNNRHRYLWSATLLTKDFTILSRGTKFLNSFASYNSITYLNSSDECLYNSENLIPLQQNHNIDYNQFCQRMLANPITNYVLEQKCQNNEETSDRNQVISMDFNVDILDFNENPDQNKILYNSWVIYRYQNCLEVWKECRIQEPGETFTKIVLMTQPSSVYQVLTIDVISMEETEIEPHPI